MVRHRLRLNFLDNIVGPDKATLIACIMSGYEIDIAKWIAHEIRDRATSIDTVLAFPYLYT